MTTTATIGKYSVVREIAQGGFGKTLLAENAEGKRVVLKQFNPQQHNIGSQALRLFDQECDRLKEVGHHEQIPSFIEYFEEGEDRFIVQEYILGQTLKDELKESGTYSEAQILSLLKAILPVIGFIHHKQVIHRDIKPENIIRRSDGKLFLVDFGASKSMSDSVLAKTGTMIGSALYTAPEQIGGKATYASDLYSLGLTCIHLITNMSPIELYDIGEDQWIWQDFCTNKASEGLAKILNKMMARGINYRHSSAAEVLLAISAFEKNRKEVEEEQQAAGIAKSETRLPSRFKRNTIVILVVTAFATSGIAIWRVNNWRTNNSGDSETPPAVERLVEQPNKSSGLRFPVLDAIRDEIASDETIPKEIVTSLDYMLIPMKLIIVLIIISGALGLLLKFRVRN
ncbi:MAG: serine/threonine protein kinase [Acaryochloris sp. RU_4_1]|nr:serine/threonine protein kinase [Acaryochloris sp. RU_4_1]NJR56055.1 serine/threonine protein kinase [Acaryochloris sp. CRU_2_0]